MAGITFTEGSGLQDSIFGKSQAPIRMFLEKRGEAFEQQSMLKELFNKFCLINIEKAKLTYLLEIFHSYW